MSKCNCIEMYVRSRAHTPRVHAHTQIRACTGTNMPIASLISWNALLLHLAARNRMCEKQR